MMYVEPIVIFTDEYCQYFIITDRVREIVARSGIKNGMVTVLSKHTTTGVTVNESLECLQSDIDVFLSKLAPEDAPYSHNRMLRDYGSTGGNPTGHLKSLVVGNHCHFAVLDGEMTGGGAQDVIFCEFDGPSKRTVNVIVQGE